MKKHNLKWIVAIGSSLIVALLITTDALTSDFTKVTANVLHFKGINKNIGGRGSLNYDLYVQENDKHYKIGANWAGCFYYDNFINTIKPGSAIIVSVLKYNGLVTNSDLLQVIDIESNNVSYLSSGCASDSVENQKIIIPIVWLAVAGLTAYYYFEIIRKKKKRGYANSKTY